MTNPSAVRNIPLSKLVLSPGNVRKTPPTPSEEAELKASIRARGLKQNLVVHPSADEKGVHAVTAGGRRLKALQELAAEGVIPADTKVPCLVEAEGEALETSLMENTIRAAMHPADEFVAMAALIDAGETVEAVALRFGVSERHVRQRLRLGKVAPELLDEFRAGEISLEVMTAFTLGADQETQLAVWRQVKEQSYVAPYTVKRLLTKTAVPADSALGTFVGIAAKAHRLQVTRAHLAGDFGVAFDLALYSLAVGVLHQGYRSRPVDLRAIEARPRSSLNDLAGTPADRLLEAHRNALDLDWLSLPPAEGFAALSALPPEAKQRLFAWCTASCLNAQLAVEDRADPVVECVGQRLAIPFADCWRPTAANYWGRVKKAHGLAIAREILGDRWARDHADDKKATIAAALEKAFDPTTNTACIGLDQAARDGAAAWLPPGMAYGDGAVDANPADLSRRSGAKPDPDLDGASDIETDPSEAEPGDADAASSDLPAFLTEDGPSHAGLNGATAP